MTALSRDIPTLHVEGKNDKFTIAELLQRHGVNMSEGERPFNIIIPKNAHTGAEGVEPLLETMADAIRNATDRPIGFVLDVDIEMGDRWNAVVGQLRKAGLTPPVACPSTGYVDRVPDYPHPVGVWLMPDCLSDHGKLEHLIHTLIPPDDRAWPHAKESTESAKRDWGAAFKDVDRAKAEIHCWLAWQNEPGVPFGTAIRANFLRHDSPEALAFLRWLRNLFNLDA